jgi:Leucine-rich repeat (LRR) protein
MGLHKTSSWFLILMASAVSCVNAAQKDFEVSIQRSPTTPTYFHDKSPHQSPIKSSPVRTVRNYRPLEIDTPLFAHQLGQLMDRDCNEIYLLGVYVGELKNDTFFKSFSLTVSPDIINPDVEVLSLKCCGLTDEHIKRIGEFKKLRKLTLASNHLTDDGVISVISKLEKLESLSLALNKEVSNACVPALLAMPNLTELDLSHNENIGEESASAFLGKTHLKNLDVRFTGIPRQIQRKIEDKYK